MKTECLKDKPKHKAGYQFYHITKRHAYLSKRRKPIMRHGFNRNGGYVINKSGDQITVIKDGRLAEKLARQHGKAGALAFFDMMGPDVQNFFFNIAQQLIDFGSGWVENKGSSCTPSPELIKMLKELPRHPELYNKSQG